MSHLKDWIEKSKTARLYPQEPTGLRPHNGCSCLSNAADSGQLNPMRQELDCHLTEQIQGKRFSQVYLRRPELQQDSDRMRNRLAMVFHRISKRGFNIVDTAEHELGIRLGLVRSDFEWTRVVRGMEMRDVLDMITIVCVCFRNVSRLSASDQIRPFLETVTRIFQEEQMGYRVDPAGGVHYAVDPEFETGRVATITALGRSRYNGVRSLFEAAFTALDGELTDGKTAIRQGFFATESLFRLMFPKAQQLGTGEVQTHLSPLVDRIYAGQRPGLMVAKKRLAALRSWIEAAHFYRHEPGSEEPAQPPLELAIYMLADAGAHVRWLAFLDERAAG